jgi:hypothetical protein
MDGLKDRFDQFISRGDDEYGEPATDPIRSVIRFWRVVESGGCPRDQAAFPERSI